MFYFKNKNVKTSINMSSISGFSYKNSGDPALALYSGGFNSTSVSTEYYGKKSSTKTRVYATGQSEPIIVFDSDTSINTSQPSININYSATSIKVGTNRTSLSSDDLVLVYVRTPSHTIDNTSYPDWRIGHNYTSAAPVEPIDSFSSGGTFTAKYKVYKMKKTSWNVNLSTTGANSIIGDEVTEKTFKSIITTNTDNFYFDALIGNDHTGETAWSGIITGNRWESFMSIGTYSLSKNTCTLQSQSNLTFLAKCTFDTLQAPDTWATFTTTEAHLDSIDTGHLAFGGVTDWTFTCKGNDNYLRRGFSAVSGLFPSQIPYFKEGYVYSNVTTWGNSYDNFEMDFNCQIGYNKNSYGDIGVAIVVWRNGNLILDPNGGGNEDVCLIKDTLIAMANGDEKPIQDIQVGDEILSYDLETNTTCPAVVMYSTPIRKQQTGVYAIFSSGDVLCLTRGHNLYSIEYGRYLPIEGFKEGDHTFNKNGEIVELMAIHWDVELKTYEWFYHIISSNNLYFANNIMNAGAPIDKYRYIHDIRYESIPSEIEELIFDESKDAACFNFTVTNPDFIKLGTPYQYRIKRASNQISDLEQSLKMTENISAKIISGLKINSNVLQERISQLDKIDELREQIKTWEKSYNELLVDYSNLGEDILLPDKDRREKYFKRACQIANNNIDVYRKYYKNQEVE